MQALPEMIRRYAEGEKIDFTAVPLDLAEVPEFNRQAYAELLKIGYGETTTYGAIARVLGDVAMSRAVGRSTPRSRIAPILP